MRTRPIVLFTTLASVFLLLALPTIASATFPGNDGSIYFACRATTTPYAGTDICSVRPDGTAFQNLTNTPTAREGSPSASRDGRQIAFLRSGADGKNYVWVMNADGSGQRQLSTVPAEMPRFHPDGRVVYRANTAGTSYELQAVSTRSGAPSTFYTPQISGSTQGLSFSLSGSFTLLRMMPAGQTRLGQSFAGQVFVIDGKNERAVTDVGTSTLSNHQPSWSPDGSAISFIRGESSTTDIWRVSSGGGEQQRVTNFPSGVRATFPSVSPSGQRMVWSQQNPGDSSKNTARLMVATSAGASPVELTLPGYPEATHPEWASAVGGATDIKVKAAKKLKLGRKVNVKKKLTVKITCIGSLQCVTTYGATLRIPTTKRKAKSFKVKNKTVRIAAGKTKTVKITLPRKAAKTLRTGLNKRKKPTLTLTVTGRTQTKVLIRKQTVKVAVAK